MSVGETAEMAFSLIRPTVEDFGLGTGDQKLPSQCSISAPSGRRPRSPTAHAFVGPSDTTPYRPDPGPLPLTDVGTTVHAVPSQRMASGSLTLVPVGSV